MAVTVLGKTFNNEEERRKYFQEELRKKLPELKKMEGFPIGKDEDIIQLSDPPYYTACPNPWLNNFISDWENSKQASSDNNVNSSVNEPFASDVSVGKRNPIYTAHTYHTKVPHPAIMRYILHYTKPGDIVFDGFAGTGMTGVASSVCKSPNQKQKIKIEKEFKINDIDDPIWGERKAICGDLSPIASFISGNYNNKIDVDEFIDNAEKLLGDVQSKYKWMYKTLHSDGKTLGKVKYYVWSDVFVCPECSNELVFYDVAVDTETGKVDKNIKCPSCTFVGKKRKYDKAFESYYDPINGNTQKEIKRKLVLISYWVGNNLHEKKPDKQDYEILKKVNEIDVSDVPIEEIPKGDKTGEPLRLGIKYAHQMFFKRTLIIMSELYKKANSNPLRLLINSQITNLSKQNRYRPGVSYPFNPFNGTLYIGSQVSEANPFWAYKNKVKRLAKAFRLTDKSVTYTGDAGDTGIKNNSVDYIFTDPPFGLNLMYSELNFFMESWLGVKTNNTTEAIENKSQNKSQLEYSRLMEKCFKEFYRILKPNKWMTVEFSNTSAAIWNGIQTALQNSGFIIANVSSLDKKQKSFNAITNPTSVKQDLVISCYKPSKEFSSKIDNYSEPKKAVWEFVEEHLNHLPVHLQKGNSTTAIVERSPKILFDRMVAFYVQKGYSVPLDAGKFQKGLRERFIERDGMFFTNEQVQEYDRKRAEVPNFTQLSILVASEQDGVLWLQNFLKNKPKTYQDIMPEWMQALGGERKGDIIPELKTILEENFLKNGSGEWYVPDPDKEEDLEKLRNRRLLKQFETYKEQAFKPKGKIKECRVEALRAGFKQSYQDKDFETIVRVGERIPESLLMEDEVLLQFYDIAAAKV